MLFRSCTSPKPSATATSTAATGQKEEYKTLTKLFLMKQEDLRETINGEHIPNSAGITESDAYTGTGHGYRFYPEDIKKI